LQEVKESKGVLNSSEYKQETESGERYNNFVGKIFVREGETEGEA